jgi:hypothetical protein
MIVNSVILLGLVVGLAPAEEAYTIKIKKSAKGDVIKVEDQEDGENKLSLSIGGKPAPNQPPQGKEGKAESYVETILEKPDSAEKPTSLKRNYEKARFIKEGKEQTRAYEGKTVLIQKKGDKYQFQIDGGKELTGMDAEDLDKEFNKKDGLSEDELEKLLLPTKPVRVGDTWKIDGDKLFNAMAKEGGFSAEGSKATGKLVEVYEKGGRKIGKMDIEITSPITKFGEKESVKFKVAEGSKAVQAFHLDVCIDGTSSAGSIKAEVSMNIDAGFDAGGMEGKLSMNVKYVSSKKGTEQSKK